MPKKKKKCTGGHDVIPALYGAYSVSSLHLSGFARFPQVVLGRSVNTYPANVCTTQVQASVPSSSGDSF